MRHPELPSLRSHLAAGQVIPAMPLALNDDRPWSERYQRALVRYYLDAGAGALAVGVLTTQFEIRDPQHDLHWTVLSSCAAEVAIYRSENSPFAMISGICGTTPQAIQGRTVQRTIPTTLRARLGVNRSTPNYGLISVPLMPDLKRDADSSQATLDKGIPDVTLRT